jgi:hypothetical protein
MAPSSCAALPADAFVGRMDEVKLCYRRAMAGWAQQLLQPAPRAAWAEAQPQDDYHNRDWWRMYLGSVLDD